MDGIVGCRICGALVLQSFQDQHDSFHQHDGGVETVEYTDPLPLLDADAARKLVGGSRKAAKRR